MDCLSYLSNPKVVNTLGLICDIIGASFVASEVISQFKGKQFNPTPTVIDESPPPEKTEQFKEWEIKKYSHMKKGLLFLILGFYLQILAT